VPPEVVVNVVVARFPGSNCDHDCEWAFGTILGVPTRGVWHTEGALPPETDLVVLPGGFSYGDYLRCGAIAARSPLMGAVRAFAARGGAVLGICNGFQILCEAGLLPGALIRNEDMHFHCMDVDVAVTAEPGGLLRGLERSAPLRMPIAHLHGCYTASEDVLNMLQTTCRLPLRYGGHNPNGSARNVAGVLGEGGNVLGLMPHPERAVERALGSEDGRSLLETVLRNARSAS